ncbi:MAG: glycosyltransferase [Hyphomicrobiaceae bacterium]|nr:glycosyltransferase [Hyphomicrobiaceae bacterium]
MRLAVIVPTYGRPALVARLLAHLSQQSRPPDRIVISAPDASHVGELSAAAVPVEFSFGKHGLSAQRNQALEKVLGDTDVVVFFDDDFVPANDYIELLERGFAKHPDWVAVTGHVIADGIKGRGIAFDEAIAAIAGDARSIRHWRWREVFSTYGCNMAFRTNSIGPLRFDERLPLYGWQEDVDFSSQMRSAGRVVKLDSIRGVHLGAKAGRVSGRRFGYSQVVNPIYLIRKGTVTGKRGLALIARNLAANTVRSIWSEPHIDRRGRFVGNLIGLLHLAKGRIEPEHALKL